MNREDVIRIAREAGLYTRCEVHSAVPFDQLLTSFAELIAAAEREECAKICEIPWQGHPYDIAKQIRARSRE